MTQLNGLAQATALLIISLPFLASGCVATQDWVQTWVKEQIFPVEKRVSETEAGMTKMGGRVSGLEGRVETMANQIANLDSRLNQTNAKADQALENLQRLRVERKLVLDMKQGAFFTSNSTILSNQAKNIITNWRESEPKMPAAISQSKSKSIRPSSSSCLTERVCRWPTIIRTRAAQKIAASRS